MAALAGPLLLFLAADSQRFERFLALTGFDLGSLRAAIRSDGFAESLWAYLGGDEPLLLAFAAEQGLAPDEIAALALAATAPSPED